MNTFSLRLAKSNKVKKKNATRKKKAASAFEECDELKTPSITKISVLEEPELGNTETVLCIKPPIRQVSNPRTLMSANSESNSETIANMILNTNKDNLGEETPDKTELDEYNEIPIEEFGCALLRGMGWDGKYDDDKEQGFVEKNMSKGSGRPELLGIGAKQTSKPNSLEDNFMPLMKVKKEKNG